MSAACGAIDQEPPLERATQRPEVVSKTSPSSDDPQLIGTSAAMEELRRLIGVVARSEATVLIEGETGTGKELVARAVHQASRRAEGEWVVFNAATLPDQLFESELFGHARGAFTDAVGARCGLAMAAHRGTLFIDEVGEISLGNQARLLRFLDTKEVRPVGSTQVRKVDVRILCATNRDLTREVAQGRFRSDLYYRLRVLTLRTPPLRQRPEDLHDLIDHFLERFAARHGRPGLRLTREAQKLLEAHPWKGNVRELRNELHRAAILTPPGSPVRVDSFSAHLGAEGRTANDSDALNLKQRLRVAERELVMGVLEGAQGDLDQAARELRISRSALLRRLEALHLDLADL